MEETREFRERVGRIESLLQDLESYSDPALRARATELVETLMEFHGAGLDRILEIIARAGEPGAGILPLLARDPIVGSLMLLYDLHPDPFETRVGRGIEKAQSFLAPHGARLDVLEVGAGIIRARIVPGARTCASTLHDLESGVRDLLLDAAPDAAEIAIQNAAGPASGFVPLATLQGAGGSPRSVPPLNL